MKPIAIQPDRTARDRQGARQDETPLSKTLKGLTLTSLLFPLPNERRPPRPCPAAALPRRLGCHASDLPTPPCRRNRRAELHLRRLRLPSGASSVVIRLICGPVSFLCKFFASRCKSLQFLALPCSLLCFCSGSMSMFLTNIQDCIKLNKRFGITNYVSYIFDLCVV